MASDPPAGRERKPRDLKLEQKALDVIQEQYHHGLFKMRKKLFVDAFADFQSIVQLIATEPMIWVRIAECCVGAFFNKRPEKRDSRLLRIGSLKKQGILSLRDPEALQPEDFEEIRAGNISLRYAEMAILMADSLVKKEENPYLKRYIMAQSAFIATKRGRYRKAAQLCNMAIDMPTSREVEDLKHAKFQAAVSEFLEMIIAECATKLGDHDRAEALFQQLVEDIKTYGQMIPGMRNLACHHRTLAICAQRDFERARQQYVTDMALGDESPRNFSLGYFLHDRLGLVQQFGNHDLEDLPIRLGEEHGVHLLDMELPRMPSPRVAPSPIKSPEDLQKTSSRSSTDGTDRTQKSSSGVSEAENLESPESLVATDDVWPPTSSSSGSASELTSFSEIPSYKKFAFDETAPRKIPTAPRHFCF